MYLYDTRKPWFLSKSHFGLNTSWYDTRTKHDFSQTQWLCLDKVLPRGVFISVFQKRDCFLENVCLLGSLCFFAESYLFSNTVCLVGSLYLCFIKLCFPQEALHCPPPTKQKKTKKNTHKTTRNANTNRRKQHVCLIEYILISQKLISAFSNKVTLKKK